MSAQSEASSDRQLPSDQVGETSGRSAANPFPGPRPFGEDDRAWFFGRDRELSDLVALLFAHRAILVHAPSGTGKSSLVSAGLIPRARQRGFEFLPVARVRGMGSADIEASDGYPAGNRYVFNVAENWRAAGVSGPSPTGSLLDALSGLAVPDEPGRVVVFDQIEELFVLHPDRWRDRADLFSQVQAALDQDPLLHFVFVLRDDYLAWLQPLAPLLRDRLATRYHLRGLGPAQALEAVVGPMAQSGRVFAPGVAEDLVRALRQQPGDLSGSRSYEGEDVEPVQLQIVCRTFVERLPIDVTEIDAEHVARYADVQQALVGFYEQAVAAAVKGRAGVRERRVRLWFERQLITPARTRGIVFRGDRTTAGLPNHVVDDLERRRIVQSEPRGPALWYELTHDRLIDAVLASNRLWYAKRARTVTRRAVVAVAVVAAVAAVVSVLAFRHGNGGATASGVEPLERQITVPGQTIDFHIRGRAGQLLSAVMHPDQGFTGELLLFDAENRPLGSPSPPGSALPLLTRTLPSDSDYRVEARGLGSSIGSFLLTLDVKTIGTRAALSGPDPIPGSITAPDQVNMYTFKGRAGSLATIVMVGELESNLVMVGPARQGFTQVDDVSGGSVITAVLPQDGTYELHVSTLENQTGPYRLQVGLTTGTVIQPGTVAGILSDQNRADAHLIRSDTGGVLTVGYRRTALLRNVALLSADGRTLVADGGQGGFTWLTAPALTYILMVYTEDFSSRNSYSLSMALQRPLPLAGGKAQGQVSRPGQIVIYRQDATKGQNVAILVTPVKRFDPDITIIQPDGTRLIQENNGGPGQDELFTVQFRQRGLHLIVVSSPDVHGTGGFHIVVTPDATPARSAAITPP